MKFDITLFVLLSVAVLVVSGVIESAETRDETISTYVWASAEKARREVVNEDRIKKVDDKALAYV